MAASIHQPIRCPVVIGRDAQLTVLMKVLKQAADRRGQTLLISGEAGIGKSRLVEEAKALARRRNWLVLEGHSFEPDRIVPYAPLLDLLRNYLFGLAPAEVVDLLGDEARDLARILPDLAGMLSIPEAPPRLDPTLERQMIIKAFINIMLRLGNARSALVIVEDLHWSDETSLDVLLRLARGLLNSRLLLVLTYRDDEVGNELRHMLATIDRERLATEVSLQRLDAAEIGAMVRAIVDRTITLHPNLRDSLWDLTDGNPFFVEEILSTLRWDELDSSAVAWPDARVLDDLRVPRSVYDAVQHRVERLSADARTLLHLASIVGRRCDFSLLQTVSGQDEPELLRLMKELLAAQLLVEEDEDRFSFRHALTQKAVLSTLLARERRQLHRAISEAYLQDSSAPIDRHVANLAYHCYEAGEWDRALDYASRAGERAMALHVPKAAVEQFSRALDAAQRLSRTPSWHLYRARGRAFETLGDFVRARADYETALKVARAGGDQRGEWRSLLDLGLLWSGQDYEQTAGYCQRALTLARAIDDPIILAHSLNRMGNWYTNIARPHEGLKLHREALAISGASDDRVTIAETLELLGMTSYVAGNPHDSLEYYTPAIEHFRDLGDRQATSWCLSVMALCGGNYQTDACVTAKTTLDECRQRAQAATLLAQEIGWRPGEAFAQHVCGMTHAAMGQYDLAIDLVNRSLKLAGEIGHRQWGVAGTCGLGVLYLDLLDARQARELLEQALASAEEMGSVLWTLTIRPMLAMAYLLDHDHRSTQRILEAADIPSISESGQGARNCWLVRADLHLALGEGERALRIADELIATDKNLIALREAPRLARLRGEALASLGAFSKAEEALHDAVQGALALERPSLVWRSYGALGRVLRMQRRYREANEAFAAARKTIDSLAVTVPDEALRQHFLLRTAEILPGPRSLTDRQAMAQTYAGLTERECEVAMLVAQGLSNRAIAERLFVSQPTVATHVSHILAKLEFSSRTQIATWALEVGLLSRPQ